MEPDEYDPEGSQPPPPPPKAIIEFPTPDLPPIPSDDFDDKSPSQISSPSRHPETVGSSSSLENGVPEALFTPPTLNPATDDSIALPSPSSLSFKGKQAKKSNPLTDLVESEREYIDILADIIRKVAGAWSRTNFPPKQLDVMFRGIESVYKANRGLLTKLKDIGPTPTSAKALGDLLMRWIDDLDAPYTKYCTNFATGFDEWSPVTSNTRLPPILAALSSVHPPPLIAASPDDNIPTSWTLDALFSLPRGRLKYYKKLYTRLLRSTQAGRSDHRLLTGAVDKLESLLSILVQREGILIGVDESENTVETYPPPDSRTHSPPSDRTRDWAEKLHKNISSSEATEERSRQSMGSSAHHSSPSSETRLSQGKDSSRMGGRTASSATMSMPVSDLERRLCTEITLDLFTLKPRAVRLQMNPPSLHFTRTLRLSQDVEIHFTPRLTPDSPRIHTRGHIFLLTDLFLVCERMTPEERDKANFDTDGQDYDMWLVYPPLAGKHLRVLELPEYDTVLQIQVLKKEVLFLHTDSKATRDHLLNEFKECIEAGNLLSPRASQPPPPVPPLKPMLQSSSDSALREPQLNANARANSVSPVTVSSMNPSPQPYDQGRHPIESAEFSRHTSFPPYPETQQPFPSPVAKDHSIENVSPNDPRDGRIASSSSQPQMQHLGPPVPPRHARQGSSLSATAPYVPPPRGASHLHPAVMGQMGPPIRPATAPGEPQPWGPSVQSDYPGQHPPQNSGLVPRLPGPYQNGQNAHSGSARPPSDPMANFGLHKSPSAHSLRSQVPGGVPPPLPGYDVREPPAGIFQPRNSSMLHIHQPLPRVPLPPPATFGHRENSLATTSSWVSSTREPSPPMSPLEEPVPKGPVISTIIAQFKCKIFLQLHHGQWKSLGGARLKLFLQQPTNVKQIVVEADSKEKTMIISTIVLTDGVERVGKTGVAIELSDKGTRTGIVYMIQLRNETSASGLFDSLLAGSDRAAGRTGKG